MAEGVFHSKKMCGRKYMNRICIGKLVVSRSDLRCREVLLGRFRGALQSSIHQDAESGAM